MNTITQAEWIAIIVIVTLAVAAMCVLMGCGVVDEIEICYDHPTYGRICFKAGKFHKLSDGGVGAPFVEPVQKELAVWRSETERRNRDEPK